MPYLKVNFDVWGGKEHESFLYQKNKMEKPQKEETQVVEDV